MTTPDNTADTAPVEVTDATTEVAETRTETTEPTADADAADEGIGALDDEGDDADNRTTANKEAQKWRQKLRATEAERDTLTARLAVLQRSEVERIAANVLADPGDMFRDGAQLADLLDESGNIDAAKVKAAATAAVTAHPHWAKREAVQRIKRGALASGATGMDSPIRASWADVIRGQ